MAFKKFDDIVDRSGNASKLKKFAAIFRIIKVGQDFIEKTFSPAIAGQIKISAYRDGVLSIQAKSAPGASEIKMQEKNLIKYIETELKGVKISKIRIIL